MKKKCSGNPFLPVRVTLLSLAFRGGTVEFLITELVIAPASVKFLLAVENAILSVGRGLWRQQQSPQASSDACVPEVQP